MAVTITRLRNGEVVSDVYSIVESNSNPWDLADLTVYLHYNCPECSFMCKQDFIFENHMNENHRTFKSNKPHTDDLISKFLIEEGVNKAVDILKSSQKLPLKGYFDPNPSPWLVTDKEPKSFSVSITKVDKNEVDFHEEDSYYEPLEDLGKC